MPANIDKTVDFLSGKLQDLAADQGVKSIDGWLGKIEEADFHGSKVLHENLTKLKNLLQSDDLDGAAITELLGTLGEETARAANKVEGKEAEGLQRLAERLQQLRS